MSGSDRVVVVGASLAGLRAAEAVRRSGHAGEIVVVGDEPHMPYNRPPLSKDALISGPSFDELALRPPRAAQDIRFMLGVPVAACDVKSSSVTLLSGHSLEWGGLVVATGLSARQCSVPGPHGGRHVVRSFGDAAALGTALKDARHVVVIGAGFVGCEIAATARQQGANVTVVAPESVPLERALGAIAGEALQRRHERHGIAFRLGVVPVAFSGTDSVEAVQLSDGTELPADVVVEAIGASPNVSWLEGNEFDLSDGILCDNAMRALGHRNVVACGDVARFPSPWYDSVPRRIEHWTMAIDTARQAGRTLAQDLAGVEAGPISFAPLPSFWSDQFGVRIQSVGVVGGGHSALLLEGEWDGECAVGYQDGDQLTGVLLIGLQHRLKDYRDRVAMRELALLP